jgi:hypothetical protein
MSFQVGRVGKLGLSVWSLCSQRINILIFSKNIIQFAKHVNDTLYCF